MKRMIFLLMESCFFLTYFLIGDPGYHGRLPVQRTLNPEFVLLRNMGIDHGSLHA